MQKLKRFQSIVDELNIHFSVNSVIIDEFEKGRLLLGGKYKNSDALLKLYKMSKYRLLQVEKEVTANIILDTVNKKFKKVDVVGHGSSDFYIWLIREYSVGESLSNPAGKKLSGLFNHDIIDKRFEKHKYIIINNIADGLNYLSEIKSEDIEKKFNIGIFNTRFDINLNEKKLTETQNKFNINLSRQSEFYNNFFHKYSDKSKMIPSMGDLMPSNILICPDKSIKFMDFEHFNIDNYLLDGTFLWLFLWNYPDWQQELIKRLIKTQADQENFRASIIRLLLSCFDYFKINPSDKYAGVRAWQEYLQAAGQSFEEIMMVRVKK